MSKQLVATIRPGMNRGWLVYVNGGYWTTFPSYNEAAEACNKRGYKVF